MLIIVEGADGVGKSTLIRELYHTTVTSFPGDVTEVVSKGPPTLHPLQEYETPLFNYRPGNNHHIICDRWHVGEWIYPTILKRTTDADIATLRHIELFLQSRGAVIVHLKPNYMTHMSNFLERGDTLIQPHMLRLLRIRYTRHMSRTSIPVVKIKRLNDPFSVNRIIYRARNVEAQSKSLNKFITYVGSPYPRVLLLGDVRHDVGKMPLSDRNVLASSPSASQHYGPAFMPFRGTSGHYLLTHLPSSVWFAGIGIANACDVDNVISLVSEISTPDTKIVALGTNALHQLLSKLRVSNVNRDVGAVPHPQYVRRFYNAQGDFYGRLIRSAIMHNLQFKASHFNRSTM